MLNENNRFKDALNEELSAYQLKRYISVKQINSVFKFLMPFKFKTLMKLEPKAIKGATQGMLDFFNGKDIVINYGDEGCIPLWNEDEIPEYNGEEKPYIVPFLLENKKAPAVLVIPGGAYLYVSMRDEGIKTAKRLNELGFHAIVLSYRVSPARFPAMQLDMMRAIQIMRNNAEAWGIIPNQIIALGYSAGGHLALSVNGLYEELKDKTGDLSHIDARPNAIVSGYGMCDLKCKSFTITCDMIFLGDKYSKKESDRLCIQSLVNKDYPPIFMFSMENDPTVPPKTNCIELKKILDELSVPNEMRIYKGNRHGFNLAEGDPAEEWQERMVEFLKRTKVI